MDLAAPSTSKKGLKDLAALTTSNEGAQGRGFTSILALKP